MSGHKTHKADDATTDPADDATARAWDDYKQDQLQQVRNVSEHAQTLQTRAPARIAAVSHARKTAKAQPGTLDDYHVVQRWLDEQAFYPPHDQRKESPEYAKVHHQIVVEEDHRCLVCGVKNSTLHDVAQNPFGAVQIETHHRTIEWALANAVDEAKFNQHIRPGLLRESQGRPLDGVTAAGKAIRTEFDKDYADDMALDTIHAWVDHAFDNLWPLCDVHHRHKYVGIHAITGPIWGPQDVMDAKSVTNQITLAHQKGGASKPPKGSTGG